MGDSITLSTTCAAVASVLTVVSFVPYVRSIIHGDTIPHVFSWVIWSVTTLLAGGAQWAGGGGLGAWTTVLSGALSVMVGLMAFHRRHHLTLSRSDYAALSVALGSIPIWAVTSNPAWASVLLSIADTVGLWPTLRKCWTHPNSENTSMYLILALRNIVSLGALDTLSITTVVFPVTMSITIAVLLGVIRWRTHAVSATRHG